MVACQSWVRAPLKAPVVSLSKKRYPHCLVLVGSRNGFTRDLHNRTKINKYELSTTFRRLPFSCNETFFTMSFICNYTAQLYILTKQTTRIYYCISWRGDNYLPCFELVTRPLLQFTFVITLVCVYTLYVVIRLQ